MKEYATEWVKGLTIRSMEILSDRDAGEEHNAYSIRIRARDKEGLDKVFFVTGNHDGGPDFSIETPDGRTVEPILPMELREKRCVHEMVSVSPSVVVCRKCWKVED